MAVATAEAPSPADQAGGHAETGLVPNKGLDPPGDGEPPLLPDCLLDEDAKEGPPLPSSSPFWAEITPHDAAGKALADLPPDGGYFELVIPKALLADDADTLKLRWVDFWR